MEGNQGWASVVTARSTAAGGVGTAAQRGPCKRLRLAGDARAGPPSSTHVPAAHRLELVVPRQAGSAAIGKVNGLPAAQRRYRWKE